jgi:GT2 family glycosyltransferase
MRVRAVVVNFNGGDEILGGLRALLASELTAELEVVVVDNGSTDGSPERIEAFFPSVQVFRSPGGNVGYPGINQVIRDLSGVDLVAVINPDAVVAPDCLQLLADALANDPGLGAACPLILLDGDYREIKVSLDGPERASLELLAVDGAGSWHLTGPKVRRRWNGGVAWTIGDGSVLRTTAAQGWPVRLTVRGQAGGTVTLRSGEAETQWRVGRKPSTLEVAAAGDASPVVQNAGSLIGPHGLGENRGYHQNRAFAAGDVPAWCGAAVLMTTAYLQDVGLFDERWFLYYEDTDLAWRGLLRGWRYAFVPAAVVRHAHSTTIGHGSALYDVQHERNRLLTVTKNAPRDEVRAAWVASAKLVVNQLRGDVVARLRDRRTPEPALTLRRLTALARAARLVPSVRQDRTVVRGGATIKDGELPILGRWTEPTGPTE